MFLGALVKVSPLGVLLGVPTLALLSPRCPDHSAAGPHGATWGHGGVDVPLGSLLAPSSRNATSEGRASKCTSFTWERHERNALL